MKKQWAIAVVVLWATWMLSGSAMAVKVLNLYQADLAVASQSDEMREQAVQDGFLQVLMRVSGDENIGSHPVIKRNLNRADYYVREFSYSSATTQSSEYALHVRYEEKDVNRLLKQAGVVCHGSNRPLLLVWLVVTDKDQQKDIISSEATEEVHTLLRQQSKRLGLPVIFPIMDVEDVKLVSVDDVANMSLDVLNKAARRYAPDGLLIGEIDQQGDIINSQWQLIFHDAKWNWKITDKSTEGLIVAILNQVRLCECLQH